MVVRTVIEVTVRCAAGTRDLGNLVMGLIYPPSLVLTVCCGHLSVVHGAFILHSAIANLWWPLRLGHHL